MPKQDKLSSRLVLARAVPRRDALKGLGALAISWPVLGAGCSKEEGEMMQILPAGGAGQAGAPPAGVAGSAGTPGASGSPSVATPAGSGGAGGAGGAPGSGGASGSVAAGSGGAAGNAGTGGSGGAMTGGSGGATAGSGGAAAGSDFVPVMFPDVAACALTPTDFAGEGPFFIHEDEVMDDVDLMRADMREDRDGVELQLNIRVLDSEGDCMEPISGVEVYVWHTDALGLYSGFDGQDPNQTYSGGLERTVENDARFCRGIQLSDDDGIVKFRTVYPGWYNGRAIHIHFVALRPGSGPGTASYRGAQYMVFTTQMYFAEQFSRMIHENHAPYMTRASGAGYNQYVKPQNMTVMPTTRMEGDIVVAALNIVTAGSGSRR